MMDRFFQIAATLTVIFSGSGFALAVPPEPEIILQPDNHIGTKAKNQIGDGIYHNKGKGQKISKTLRPFGTITYYFTVENDGNVADTIRVRATKGIHRLDIRYFLLGGKRPNNITRELISKTGKLFQNLEPGSKKRFKATVKAKKNSRKRAKTFWVKSSSVAKPIKRDAAKARITVLPFR